MNRKVVVVNRNNSGSGCVNDESVGIVVEMNAMQEHDQAIVCSRMMRKERRATVMHAEKMLAAGEEGGRWMRLMVDGGGYRQWRCRRPAPEDIRVGPAGRRSRWMARSDGECR